MKWWQFHQDNGDGSFSTRRYRTEGEAKEALEWFEENCTWFDSDGEGVFSVDTDSVWFFDTLERNKKEYD